MRVDAITCCSGNGYANRLRKALPIWLNTLDSLTIVCKPTDSSVLEYVGPSNLKIVTTDVFDKFEAHFNKGAALCCAYAESNPTDWALSIDADVMPPPNWRTLISKEELDTTCLYGTGRRIVTSAIRSPMSCRVLPRNRKIKPYGYFQLWHTSYPPTWKWPLFDTWYSHCGRYDYMFMMLWPENNWRALGFELIHQGSTVKNWFGEGSKLCLVTGRKSDWNPKLSPELNKHLPIPQPVVINLNRGAYAPEDIQVILAEARKKGPFAVKVTITDTPEAIKDTPVETIKDLINGRQTYASTN